MDSVVGEVSVPFRLKSIFFAVDGTVQVGELKHAVLRSDTERHGWRMWGLSGCGVPNGETCLPLNTLRYSNLHRCWNGVIERCAYQPGHGQLVPGNIFSHLPLPIVVDSQRLEFIFAGELVIAPDTALHVSQVSICIPELACFQFL